MGLSNRIWGGIIDVTFCQTTYDLNYKVLMDLLETKGR